MTRVLVQNQFCWNGMLGECNATQRIFERRKTILRSLANTWPRVLTRLVGRSRAIFGLEVGSRCVNRAEEMDWSEPVAELYTKLASRTPRWRGGHGRLSPWKTAPVPSPHVGRCEDARVNRKQPQTWRSARYLVAFTVSRNLEEDGRRLGSELGSLLPTYSSD